MLKLVALFLLFFQKCCSFDLDDVAYDKMPPLFSLDDYDRCLLHNGTYCLIRVDLYAEPGNQLMDQIIAYTESTHVKHYNHTYLQKGVCVTKTCQQFIGRKDLNSSTDVQEILEKCMDRSISEEYGLHAKVPDVYYCENSKKKEEVQTTDWVVLAAILSVVFVNILATFYDLTLDEGSQKTLSRGQRLLLCFSIKRNYKHLVSDASTDSKQVQLRGLAGIRVCSSFAMVLGHVIWIQGMGFMDNPHDFERAFSILYYQIIFNGMLLVQPFFLMSGFLLIYNLENAAESHKVTWKIIPVIYLNRFLRLAPPLTAMLAFTATWMRFVSSGPLWQWHAMPVVNDCRSYWWTHLLFINNYVQDNKFCAIQTWHIAADTQLFFVGITIYLLTRRRYRNALLGLLMLISFILPALHVYYQDLDAVQLKTPQFLRSLVSPNFTAYVMGHNNISCFILGMFLAYKLHEWQRKGVVFKGKIYTIIFRLYLPVYLSYFFLGNLFYEEDYRTPLWVKMLYQGIHRLLVGLPPAFCMIGLVMGWDTKIMGPIMNWSGFTVLGRLTYAVYLLHMNFVPILAGSKTTLVHFSYLHMMVTQFGVISLTVLIALPFYLMFEAPINIFVKVLLTPSRRDDPTLPEQSKSIIAHVARKKRKADKEGKERLETVQENDTKKVA